ncbi:hypothetical protein JYU34_000135 [Plutella xylostella]|uniref:Protein kinase domain-containing protein n=1 Tax=Plutella xylostella TaxID=51655 RepID=A0ABQ7R6X9_PLUXY|nr:hypothetical protein JYU34_000135 [Plutella xylostella]
MHSLPRRWVLAFRNLLSLSAEDQWEVPFEAVSELVYLGSGAQGVVFSGMFRGEMVAVKKLRDKSETDFKHLRKLNHENIVRFRGVCTQPPCYCVIMEFCQYGPLYDFLHSGVTFAPKQILKWAKEIAQGMAYLHQHKIIHRDLKSPNILIADNLVVKVSDFGTSREWDDASAIMSFTGTVAWMAPEIIRHEPCSERVDVWSYGVVLWELLTQEVPYKKVDARPVLAHYGVGAEGELARVRGTPAAEGPDIEALRAKYQNLEAHAIMWGVGTNTVSLPIPSTCPESLQLLMAQCWNRVPRNRPPFKIIVAHLEIAGGELSSIRANNFGATQAEWRKEVQDSMDKMYNQSSPNPLPADDAAWQRRSELRHARDIRQVYEQQLKRANDLYMEVCAVRLQLEQREKTCSEREKALKACKCTSGLRKKFNRQASSSSDSAMPQLAFMVQAINKNLNQALRKRSPDVVPKEDKDEEAPFNNEENPTVTIKVEELCSCSEGEESDNNNVTDDQVEKQDNMKNENVVAKVAEAAITSVITKEPVAVHHKDTVVEYNGNHQVNTATVLAINENDNYVPDLAHV